MRFLRFYPVEKKIKRIFSLVLHKYYKKNTYDVRIKEAELWKNNIIYCFETILKYKIHFTFFHSYNYNLYCNIITLIIIIILES